MIGGNVTATLQTKSSNTSNTIGEKTTVWADYLSLTGYLDFMSQTTGRTNFNSKIEESTHVFICDYIAIDKKENQLKFVCDGKDYDIQLIDDPMRLHQQLEIYLKYVGD